MYRLQKYGPGTKHTCPDCGRSRKFVRYVNSETGEYLSEKVGRCDREEKCGYHYKPKDYFADNKLNVNYRSRSDRTRTQQILVSKKPICYMPSDIFKASLKQYDQNNLITFLQQNLGTDATSEIIGKYFIGTSTYWSRSTIFWYIDISGKIRGGKVMQYDSFTGKRVKVPYDKITWMHSVLNIENFVVSQCFFGEHLLNHNSGKTVAIVESEKTAIIASAYLPNFIWIACGGLSNLPYQKCKILKGRNVIFFPDLKCFEKWQLKAQELSSITNVAVSDILEKVAFDDDRAKGLDIADYLIRMKAKKVFQ